ncbi:MAG: exosortase/archaeosortase family protein [Verrucomicrobiaceae bacterium]|nr:exosortase/archaeosortase family protein [Verrucomicrobiaceae bacterium]
MTSRPPSRLFASLWPAVAALVLLVGIVPYAGGYEDTRKTIIGILMDRWFASESTTWQYGAIVPFVVAWLVWRKREILKTIPVGSSLLGLGTMIVAMLSYFVGYKANNYYFGYLAIQLFVFGAIIWQLGWSWMRQLAFPWLVLGTAWPLYFLEDRLGFPLRMLSTEGVMLIVKLLHLPVIAEGTSLFSASSGEAVGSWMTLKVDGPCSGMNTLFALMFIALLFAHHQQPTFVRRCILFALSIPLAIIGNMVRIGMLIGGCRLFGQDFAVGNHENEMSSFHLLAGLAVFVVAFTGLQTISLQMNRWFSHRKTPTRQGSALPLNKAHAPAP